MPAVRPAARLRSSLAVALVVATSLSPAGCRKPRYDTSTPERTIDAMAAMVRDGRPGLLPTMLDIEAREVTFPDGVTEASAIEDVKRKAGDMLAQLWRVSGKLRTRYPKEVDAEIAKGGSWMNGRGMGDAFTSVLADPFGWLDANRSRLTVADLGDGTAAFELDGKPVLGGVVSMRETPAGWRVSVPTELIRSSGYFPDTREEWAVVAYLMLAVENALGDFEAELDEGRFRSLGAASERAGRMIAESAAAQAIIFAMMQQNDGDAKPGGIELRAGDAQIRIGGSGDVGRDLGNAGDVMRRRAEP